MEFEWDEENQNHLARHKVNRRIVRTIADGPYELFTNVEGETGTHIMIGPGDTGRLYTIILLDLGEERWRPITGWASDRPEIQMYWEERGRHG